MGKTAVVHDYFETADGGGKLSCLLAREAASHLVCGYARAAHPYFPRVFSGPLFPLAPRVSVPFLRQLFLCFVFLSKGKRLAKYETVVFSGSYAPLAVLSGVAHRNILYCHTPPRFAYDQSAFFTRSVPAPLRAFFRVFLNWYRRQFEAAVTSMDVLVCNSQTVRRRIRRYLHRDAIVIYPPCETSLYSYRGQKNFYLSVARLDRLKRVDRIIEAFRRMPEKRLVVVSAGPEEKHLRRLGEGLPNVVFLGTVGEDVLLELLGTCIAVIYIPKEEDFGMVPLEAMASGKPVIGVREGGVAESVIHEQTGLLLEPDSSVETLMDAVKNMTPEKARALRGDCEARAQNFDLGVFVQRMMALMDCRHTQVSTRNVSMGMRNLR